MFKHFAREHRFAHQTWFAQEIGSGKRMICGTMTYDTVADGIKKRVATKLYNDCRSGALSLPGFPDFAPMLQALKDGQTSATTRQYQVCAQCQTNLVVLEAFAKKFTESEVTRDKAMAIINEHNEKYNDGGDFWMPDESRPLAFYRIYRCF